MVEIHPHNPDLWDEMVVHVLGPEWLYADPWDQLVAMIEDEGDPEAVAREMEGVLG